jgi:hypothetical protein
MNEASMGFPEVGEMHPGNHGCALYAGPDERDRLLVPFLQEGLRHGDECVCLIDGAELGSLRRRARGPSGPDDVRRTRHLGVYPAADVCPRAGELSVKQALTLLATPFHIGMSADTTPRPRRV